MIQKRKKKIALNSLLESRDKSLENTYDFDRLMLYLKKMDELNSYVRSFDEEQQIKMIERLKNNEVAQNRMLQIIDNHLKDNFNFESLMIYLKKPEKRNTLSI